MLVPKRLNPSFRRRFASLRLQIGEKEGLAVMLSLENEVLKTTAAQAYTKGCEQGTVTGQASVVSLYKNFQDLANQVLRHGSSFYIDGQFKHLGNLTPDFD
ncbi:UNVERIFIED_CONTAM: hypothetical protein Sindi_0814300 [Sesamum indicum]